MMRKLILAALAALLVPSVALHALCLPSLEAPSGLPGAGSGARLVHAGALVVTGLI